MSMYFTPAEIIEKFPELKFKHNWTENLIGQLLKANLLAGYYQRSSRMSMIDENSVRELIVFLNSRIESQKIEL